MVVRRSLTEPSPKNLSTFELKRALVIVYLTQQCQVLSQHLLCLISFVDIDNPLNCTFQKKINYNLLKQDMTHLD